MKLEGEVSSYSTNTWTFSLQEIPEIHRKILTIIGYVFVPISLVFLLATIVSFVLLK